MVRSVLVVILTILLTSTVFLTANGAEMPQCAGEGQCSNDGYPTRNGTCPGSCKWCVGPEYGTNTCRNIACGAFCFADSDCAGSPVCNKCNQLTDMCSTPLTCGQTCPRGNPNWESVCDASSGCGYCFDTGNNLAVCTPHNVSCGAACFNASDCQGLCDLCVFGQCSKGNTCGQRCQKNDDCVEQGCSVCNEEGRCASGIPCGAKCTQSHYCNPSCSLCNNGTCVGCPGGNPCSSQCANHAYCHCVEGDWACVLRDEFIEGRNDVKAMVDAILESSPRRVAEMERKKSKRRLAELAQRNSERLH